MDSVQMLRLAADGKVVMTPQVKTYIADEIERYRAALNEIIRETISDENVTHCELAYICQYAARHALRGPK